MSGLQTYNTGGTTSSVGEQLNDFHYSRLAVLEAAKVKTFSQLGALRKQPKHYGVTFKKYHEYPILHEANINDQGVDANGLTMDSTKWYAWDNAGTRTEHATLAAAKASAGQVRVQSGQGNLYGSSRDFAVQNGAFPTKGEEGGAVNIVGTKRDVITANISRFSFGIRYTKTAMDLDTDTNLVVKESQKVGVAYGDIREAQIRNSLISEGLTNATFSGAATDIAEVDETSNLTFADLRMLEQSLNFARCPIDTKIITGSTKIDTKVVSASRYVFIPQEMVPTLEDMTHNGVNLWQDVAEYADGAGSTGGIAEGEVGRIRGFRFIVVYDMPAWRGESADATDGVDADGSGIEDAGDNYYTTDGKYDAFPLLIVGNEAFETLGLEGEVAKVKHGKPQVDPNTDMLGDNGSLAIEWWYGIIINHSEWIRTHICNAKIA